MPIASTDRELRVLHLEDSELDHELMVVHLLRGGLRVKALRIDSEADFIGALAQKWDAIVSDYNLPGFSGLVALDLLAASGRDVPFILVSGEIGEDTAVAAMRNGASDYLLKNNLARLVPALLHAIEATEMRHARERADRELGESQQRLRELAQHLQTSIEQERAAIAREIHDDVGGSLTALKFDLALAGGVLSLEISDNGCGLRPDDLAKVRSFGIRGLHERAGTVGGWVDLTSGQNGTTLILSVPLAVGLPLHDFIDTPAQASGDADDPSQWGAL